MKHNHTTDTESDAFEESTNESSFDNHESNTEWPDANEPAKKQLKHRAVWEKFKRLPKKWVALGLIGTLVVVAGLLFYTPLGYPIIGRFFTQDITVSASDEAFRLNISDVTIELDGAKQEFKGEGPYEFKRIKSGNHTLKITKPYYEDRTITFTIKPLSKRSQAQNFNTSLKPTGRPVRATIIDTLTGKPVEDAVVALNSDEATTNDKGEVTVVLPSSANDGDVTIKKDGYNETTTKIVVSSEDGANTLKITKVGKAYFYSKRTGKLDIYSSNLDGSDQKVVLAATGNENGNEYVKISPDRKWLAFVSTRDGTRSNMDTYRKGDLLQKIFMINLENNQLDVVDEGEADFTSLSWTNENKLAYKVGKFTPNLPPADFSYSDLDKLKLYEPAAKKIEIIYSNKSQAPSGNVYGTAEYYGFKENLGQFEVVDSHIVYYVTKYAHPASYYSYEYPNRYTIVITDLSGKVTKELSTTDYSYGFGKIGYEQISYETYKDSAYTYYEVNLNDGTATKKDKPANSLPASTTSPNKKRVAWTETRDGVEMIFTADTDRSNETVTHKHEGVYFYEWFDDDTILFINNHGEHALYAISANGGSPIKISDINSSANNGY